MLGGKMTKESKFSSDDHRAFNRQGEAFDRGETFSGIDFERGLAVVEKLRHLITPTMSMAGFALRWIQSFEAVTCSIPGAKRPDQVEENAKAADLPAPSAETMAAVRALYDAEVRPYVHQYW
jgi:aryl-alcohol dehydrogenase-like predicted oxidoreductase